MKNELTKKLETRGPVTYETKAEQYLIQQK